MGGIISTIMGWFTGTPDEDNPTSVDIEKYHEIERREAEAKRREEEALRKVLEAQKREAKAPEGRRRSLDAGETSPERVATGQVLSRERDST